MTPRLARLVVRVPIELNEAVTTVAARLFNESRIEYSHSAVVRGLIRLGLAAVAGNDVLAPLFVNVKVPRGRKKGARRPPVGPRDLTLENQHNEAGERCENVAGARRA